MSITIKDIARMLNVSHTTVSRSLNDSPLISEDTKARVREIARKYNYTPNVNAKSLVLSKSYNIGLFFSTLKEGTTAGFFLCSVRGINKVINEPYKLVVEAVDDVEDFQYVKKKNFDGIILMSQDPNDDHFIRHVLDRQIPVVVLNREIEKLKVNTVLTDDRLGAMEATKYLIRKGHRKIAFIEGKVEFRSAALRKEGYRLAMKNYDIGIIPAFVVRGNYDLESGYEAMKKLLRLKKRPSAVFCSNDDMAIGAMKAVYDAGMKVPQDISLMGFDDNGISAYLTPAITTVKRPIEDMSREGAAMLLDIINRGGKGTLRSVRLKTELEIRASVREL